MMSSKRAKALSAAIFFIGLAIVSVYGVWWPNIMLVIGISLVCRHIFLGQAHDAFLNFIIFFGVYFAYRFQIRPSFFWPTVFVIAAIYILSREFLLERERTEEEIEEDINHELEEESDRSK